MKNKKNTYKKNPNDKIWGKKFIVQTLLNGVLVILPSIIILFLLSLIFKFVFNVISPISTLLDQSPDSHHWLINILAMLILAVFIFVVGLVLRNRIGKMYFRSFENTYLSQIPLYNTIKEMVGQFSGLKEMPFKRVVLIDPYNTGVLLTGFVTEDVSDSVYTVFVPTAPNPANGNIYHVPAEKLKFIEVEPERAMRTIVGMGTGSSCLFKDSKVTDQKSISN